MKALTGSLRIIVHPPERPTPVAGNTASNASQSAPASTDNEQAANARQRAASVDGPTRRPAMHYLTVPGEFAAPTPVAPETPTATGTIRLKRVRTTAVPADASTAQPSLSWNFAQPPDKRVKR